MSFVLDDGKKERDENEQEDILGTFDKFDTDRDGFLRPADLRRLMLRLGVALSDDELQDMMREADVNKDGKIDFEEFHRIMMQEEPTRGQDLDLSTSKLTKGKPQHKT